MITLIRKDLGWLLIFLALGLVMPFFLLYDVTFDGYAFSTRSDCFERFWVIPDNNMIQGQFKAYYIVWALSGFIFGTFAAIREELTRTEEFLRHRPLSPKQFFMVKVLSCLFVILTWLVITIGVSAIGALWSKNVSIARWNMVWKYIGIGAVTFSCFGAGFFAGSLRLSWLKRLLLGGIGAAGVLQISYTVSMLTLNKGVISISIFMLVHAVLTILLLWASYCNFVPGNDSDRPHDLGTIKLSSTCIILFTIILSGLHISYGQVRIQRELFKSYPNIAKTVSNKGILIGGRYTWGINQWLESDMELNEKYEPIGKAILHCNKDGNPILNAHWTHRTSIRSECGYDNPLLHTASRSIWCIFDDWWSFSSNFDTQRIGAHSYSKAHYNRQEGLVYFISLWDRYHQKEPFMRRIGKGKENRPFSYNSSFKTLRYFNRYRTAEIAIFDADEGSIWAWDGDLNQGSFYPVSLPGDDIFIKDFDIAMIHLDGKESVVKDYNDMSNADRNKIKRTLVVKGQKGIYRWNGFKFYEAEEVVKSEVERRESNRGEIPIVFEEKDPLSPKLAIMDDNETACFSHRFKPWIVEQKWLGAKMYTYSLFRSPFFQLLSFFGITEHRASFMSAALIDPMLTPYKRFWLLAANLVLAGLFAMLAVLRLVRFGTERSRILYWGIFIFLGGVVVYLVYRIFETKRAYRVSPVVLPEEAPPMMIQSV